jgi:hypothetical protein
MNGTALAKPALRIVNVPLHFEITRQPGAIDPGKVYHAKEADDHAPGRGTAEQAAPFIEGDAGGLAGFVTEVRYESKLALIDVKP